MEKKLQVRDLTISFRTSNGKVQAVRGIDFDLMKGETLAIVGESGSGKSVTSKAILGILAANAMIEGGEIIYDGKDLIKSAQGRIAGVMRPFGYRLTEYKPRNVGGRDASCFQYAYTAQNTEMMGECCAVKEGKTVYYLHFYVRAAFQEEGFRLWQDILAKAQWA